MKRESDESEMKWVEIERERQQRKNVSNSALFDHAEVPLMPSYLQYDLLCLPNHSNHSINSFTSRAEKRSEPSRFEIGQVIYECIWLILYPRVQSCPSL